MTEPQTNELGAFTLEIWARMEAPKNSSETLASIHDETGEVFDALRFNHTTPNVRWGVHRRRPGIPTHTMGLPHTNQFVGLNQFVFTSGPDGCAIYCNGTNLFKDYVGPRAIDTFHTYGSKPWRVVFGRASQRDGRAKVGGAVEEARFFEEALTPGQVHQLWRRNPLAHPRATLLAALDADRQSRVAAIDQEITAARSEVKTFNRLVGAEQSTAMLRSYRQLMKDNEAPQVAVDRLGFRWDGKLRLDLRGQRFERIDWLKGVPLQLLWLNDNPISDLSPLRGMPLEYLALARTKVSRLDALAGMRLETLHLGLCPITDLTPLKGMPLQELNLPGAKVSDLSPLKGMPLRRMSIDHNPLDSLAPLQGAPLEWLSVRKLPAHCDLTPLRGAPLTRLDLIEGEITSLEGLEGTPLTALEIGGCLQLTNFAPLAGLPLQRLTFWGNTKVEDITPLQGMPLRHLQLAGIPATDWSALKGMALTMFEASASGLLDYSVLEGMPLKEVILRQTKGTDFSVLRGLSPSILVLERTSISDLSLIGATNLSFVDLRDAPVRDLTPLAGRNIKELILFGCKNVIDIRPLMNCRIEKLVLPPNARNVALLRDHPTIAQIAWRLPTFDWWVGGRWNGVPSKAEFWRAWDEGKRAP